MFVAQLPHVHLQKYTHYSCYMRSIFINSVFNDTLKYDLHL